MRTIVTNTMLINADFISNEYTNCATKLYKQLYEAIERREDDEINRVLLLINNLTRANDGDMCIQSDEDPHC